MFPKTKLKEIISNFLLAYLAEILKLIKWNITTPKIKTIVHKAKKKRLPNHFITRYLWGVLFKFFDPI